MTRQRIFSISALCSAIVLALAFALWVRTSFASDDVRIGHSSADGTSHADLHVRWGGSFVSAYVGRWTDWGMEDPWPATRRRFAGLRWSHETSPPTPQG